jgi:hypothetical protein
MFITDSDCITATDLTAVDPEVTTLQPVIQGPAIVGPASVIRQAVEDCCQEIVARYQGYSGYLVSGPGGYANHLAAITNNYSTSISRPRMRLNQVVVLEPDPAKGLVRRWLIYRALSFFFRALYHRKIEDRYESKMNFYEAEAKKSWQRIEWAGIPIVLTPLCAPGAIREYQAGTWGQSNVSATGSGSSDPGNQYDVVITWTGQSYLNYRKPNNSESAPSIIASIQVPAGEYLEVSLSGLNPPNGIMPDVGVADGAYSPMAAMGWNIYAGISGTALCLQNATPIPIATTTYTLSAVPGVNSMTARVGQSPDFSYAFNRVLQRA